MQRLLNDSKGWYLVPAPKGRNKPAQGNALGTSPSQSAKPCKGDTELFFIPVCAALSGLNSFTDPGPRGVALGSPVHALSGLGGESLAVQLMHQFERGPLKMLRNR